MNYIALLRKDKSSDYGVEFPDFPGCITAGSTLDEAKEMALESLQGHIRLMIEDHEDLPHPSSLEHIMSDRHHKDAVAFMVHVDFPRTKNVRFNVTMDQKLLHDITNYANENGQSRSAFLAAAAKKIIEKDHTHHP